MPGGLGVELSGGQIWRGNALEVGVGVLENCTGPVIFVGGVVIDVACGGECLDPVDAGSSAGLGNSEVLLTTSLLDALRLLFEACTVTSISATSTEGVGRPVSSKLASVCYLFAMPNLDFSWCGSRP